MPDYTDNIKISEWNSNMYKMLRLNKIQDTLNQVNGNLLAWNEAFGLYNYELKFNMCEQLYQEVESKLTPPEKKDAELLKKTVEDFMHTSPILIKSQAGYFSNSKVTINKVNWLLLRKWLFKFESKVRQLIDAHGMDTSYMDDEYGEI